MTAHDDASLPTQLAGGDGGDGDAQVPPSHT
jgi:hypothetical protein